MPVTREWMRLRTWQIRCLVARGVPGFPDGMKYLIVILLVLLALLQYRLWFSPGGMADVNELKQAQQELVRGNDRLRERNASLAAEVIDLKHGLEAVEERARSDMGMIKTDEVFYQIIDSPDTDHRDLLPETPLDEPVVAP